ncbi:hypothetical protein WDW89_23325, partial [Deltaproteobacteria bacterium TL4]
PVSFRGKRDTCDAAGLQRDREMGKGASAPPRTGMRWVDITSRQGLREGWIAAFGGIGGKYSGFRLGGRNDRKNDLDTGPVL